jgi:hypothetical protein
MQWLLALETDNDPISICRLMNTFRRKNVKIVTLSLAATDSGFSLRALVETAESEVEHLYHFLRRTEGVEHVSCYTRAPEPDFEPEALRSNGGVSYIFINAGSDSCGRAGAAESLPGSKVVFADQGKLLLEVPANAHPGSAGGSSSAALDGMEFLHLARVKTTRTQALSELMV